MVVSAFRENFTQQHRMSAMNLNLEPMGIAPQTITETSTLLAGTENENNDVLTEAQPARHTIIVTREVSIRSAADDDEDDDDVEDDDADLDDDDFAGEEDEFGGDKDFEEFDMPKSKKGGTGAKDDDEVDEEFKDLGFDEFGGGGGFDDDDDDF